MTTTITEQGKRIQKQKINLLLDEPFFGTLLMQLPISEDRSIPTFSVNGVAMRYNPDFCAKLTDTEIKGVLVHEIEHVALLHPWRRGQRDIRRCNVAGDYAINNYLKQYVDDAAAKRQPVPFTLPADALIDPAYKDLSMEEIYARLPQDPPSQSKEQSQEQDKQEQGEDGGGGGDDQSQQDDGDGQGDGNNDGQPGEPSSDGEFEDAPGDESEKKESEDNMKIAVMQAVEAAKAQGCMPAGMERMIKEAMEPKQPWQEVLREWMVAKANADYIWTQPNRRYLGSGFVLPSLKDRNAMGTLVVAVDSSGSIGQAQLDRFLGELNGICVDCSPEKVIVLVCDARVHTEQEFYRGEAPTAKLAGGGGTDFRPVFSRVEALGEDVAGLIYMTDLYGNFPDKAPEYPVLWAVTGNPSGKGPWGETLQVEL